MNRQSNRDTGTGGEGSHLDEHLCLDLLCGLLADDERRRVLDHIAVCPACERFFQKRAAQAEGLDAKMELRLLPGKGLVLERRQADRGADVERKPWLDEILSRIWANLLAATRRPRFRLAWVAAAVAVVLIVTVPLITRPPRAPDLYLMPGYSSQLRSRGIEGDAAAQSLRAGLESYESEDFKRATELLTSPGVARLGTVDETIRKMYLGSALAWQGKYQQAVEVLKDVSFRLVPGEWGREGQWTLYVALREAGRKAEADSVIRILATRPGEVGQRARRVLESENED